MIRLRELYDLINEGNKKLRVFDFDDTLVMTTSFIYVRHSDGKTTKMTPGEYAVYEPKPDDRFNYSDFQKVTDPVEIKKTTNILRRLVQSEGERRIVILTARAAYKPIKAYLKDIGFDSIYVVALADADPQKKADWIEDRIKNGFDDVYFIDDSEKNIAAVANLKTKYPSVKLRVQRVKQL
jgi:FMN phosphatase YigB (HAD superfamily)